MYTVTKQWRTLELYFLCVIFLAFQVVAVYAKPMDTKAGEIWLKVRSILEHNRKLDQRDFNEILSLANLDNVELRVAVSYALAFSADPKAVDTLASLAGDKADRVSGAAAFSLLIQGISRLPKGQSFRILSCELGTTENSFERFLIANWLGRNYESESLDVLSSVLASDNDPLLRFECLYYIVVFGNKTHLADIKPLLDQIRPWRPSESDQFLLSVIDPKREVVNGAELAALASKVTKKFE